MLPNTSQQIHLVHLFPLPNLLLNPGGKITLNIFEPRYLNLLSSCERDGVLMGAVHAQVNNECELTQKELLEIPHERFSFIYPEIGFGKVQTLAETDKGTKVIVINGDYKGRVRQVHQSEGGFLSVEVEEMPVISDLSGDMTFMYRRLRSITREKISQLLSNQREVDVLMQNLTTPQELLAFYTDHICRDFKTRLRIFEADNVNDKLTIASESLLH